MRRFTVVVSLMLALTTLAYGQANTTLGGTVEDADGAVLPGADVVAINLGTNVESTAVTNSAGAYNFQALQPGEYDVRAEFPGFQTRIVEGANLSANINNRLNFTLQVAGGQTEIEVRIDADQVMLESSPSVGEALEQSEVVSLPNVSNNVLELINVMAGVQRTGGLGITGEFAGVDASNVNVVRDGISVTDQRWTDSVGVNSATFMNPDMVGEMRMVLAPVDAEQGRGVGQIAVTTRSGGNEYHGAAVWNIRNSALDARTWGDNNDVGGPPVQTWTNQNQFTLSAGGPIVRNRTFFFALYDQNLSKSRDTASGQVLSPCAQRGIFRYYDNWANRAADAELELSGANPERPTVDSNGNPIAPATNPDGSPHNGILRHVSVFGEVLNAPGTVAADCSNVQVGPAPTTSGAWDANRATIDTSGTFDLLNSRAPAGNSWQAEGGAFIDGLNTVGHRWSRTVDGRDNLFGVGEPNPRKQINFKIDHIFTQNHKFATSYSYETVNADDTFEGWPDSFEGRVQRKPQVLSLNLTSTLSPTVLNEARFGMTRQGTNVLHATGVPGRGEELLDLLPEANGLPLILQWCAQGEGFFSSQAEFGWCGENGGLIGARGNGPSATDTIDTSPRWTVADTLSWTSGRHSYKFGTSYIKATSNEEVLGSSIVDISYPLPVIGATAQAPANAFDLNNTGAQSFRTLNPALAPGLVTDNSDRMRDLMIFLSGSLSRIEMGRFINSPDQVGTSWNNALDGELIQVRDLQQHEFNFFVKDDWKVTDNVTLNLGMRWDYYGVPYDKNGMTMTVVDGSAAMFGRTGRGFDSWLPANPVDLGPSADTQFIFVGPNSPNPDLSVYERDLNNWGPAVGFSYNIPWLGRDRTVLRGGYQLSYQGGGGGDTVAGIIQTPPGSSTQAVFRGLGGGEHFDIADVINMGLGVPAEPNFLPVEPVPVTDRNTGLTVYESNFVTPYVQNLTASLTHTFNSSFSVDVRYVGTLSRKQEGNFNLNQANLFQNGLFDAFQAARAGGESALLDEIFEGINMANFGAPMIVGQNGLTGAGLLRTHSDYNANLAEGNFTAVATFLARDNYSNPTNPGLPPIATGEVGGVLRANGFPENFIFTNPQFGNASVRGNMGHSNYHSLQSQFTVRPTYGVQTTASYTWAKNLGVFDQNGTFSFDIPWDRSYDYGLSGNTRAHTFRNYGTFNLPIGPNQAILGGSTGALARVVEGWEMSWIFDVQSGAPLNLDVERGGFYNDSNPILVGEFDPEGSFVWEDGAPSGSYFTGYTRDTDPQCLNANFVAPSLAGLCGDGINALFDSSGNPVFVHALPGERGDYRDQIFGLGTWSLDMAVTKRVQLNERVNMEVRMDATNIFNHPTPGNPNLDISGGATFGSINSKGGSGAIVGSRIFQLRARVEF
jgi:hypothetical protein